MKFTGERFIPTEEGRIRLEHLHRYAIAVDLVRGKDVLDIASGEGYGSSLMAEFARSVKGVDISSEAIQHASSKYIQENLSFIQGSALDLDFKDASFDVVVSFETIEHLLQQEQMISELKRVLKPDGIFLISSPNRPIYSEESGDHNEFHVRELDFHEFDALLKTQFQEIKYFGQRMLMASVIQSMAITDQKLRIWHEESMQLKPNVGPLVDPVYFVALCRVDAGEMPSLEASALYPSSLDMVKHYVGFAKWAQDLSKILLEKETQISKMEDSISILKVEKLNILNESLRMKKELAELKSSWFLVFNNFIQGLASNIRSSWGRIDFIKRQGLSFRTFLKEKLQQLRKGGPNN